MADELGVRMIHVIDDAVPDPEGYRAAALLCHFEDVPVGETVVFHGMAGIGANPLSDMLASDFGLTTTYAAFRLSPEGQEEPSFIHTDRDMGEWTAILYLNPEPPEGDGTIFWRRKDTGAIASTAAPEELLDEWLDWRHDALWEPWTVVAAKFNRLLLFPAPYFHSRAIRENWGTGIDARLIQLCFGTGALPCV